MAKLRKQAQHPTQYKTKQLRREVWLAGSGHSPGPESLDLRQQLELTQVALHHLQQSSAQPGAASRHAVLHQPGSDITHLQTQGTPTLMVHGGQPCYKTTYVDEVSSQLLFGTCSVKWSSWLQVTDSLRGSSSLVWSAQGGRGLSSTHSSDWSMDRR